MFRNPLRRTLQTLALTACAIALVGLSADGAAAGPRKHKGGGSKQYQKHRGHEDGHKYKQKHRSGPRTVVRHSAPRTVVRYESPRVSVRYGSHSHGTYVPHGCSTDRSIVYRDEPYWYNVSLGTYIGGVHVNVDLGNTAPRGYGYWDPYCDQWFESVSVYSAHCDHHRHEPALRVVHVDPYSGAPYACGSGYCGH